eukprot:COSAG02_NODE_5936_length_3930_cov_52.777865_2_plen_180_part_00
MRTQAYAEELKRRQDEALLVTRQYEQQMHELAELKAQQQEHELTVSQLREELAHARAALHEQKALVQQLQDISEQGLRKQREEAQDALRLRTSLQELQALEAELRMKCEGEAHAKDALQAENSRLIARHADDLAGLREALARFEARAQADKERQLREAQEMQEAIFDRVRRECGLPRSS